MGRTLVVVETSQSEPAVGKGESDGECSSCRGAESAAAAIAADFRAKSPKRRSTSCRLRGRSSRQSCSTSFSRATPFGGGTSGPGRDPNIDSRCFELRPVTLDGRSAISGTRHQETLLLYAGPSSRPRKGAISAFEQEASRPDHGFGTPALLDSLSSRIDYGSHDLAALRDLEERCVDAIGHVELNSVREDIEVD